MKQSNNVHSQSSTRNIADVFNLLTSWELSYDAIKIVIDCRINSLNRLKMLNVDDINEIFNSRELIGEKACFRYHLQKWRNENNYDPLMCNTNDRALPNSCYVQEWVDSPTTSESQHSIQEILQKTLEGKDVITKYLISNTLNDKDQTAIVRIIVDYYLFNNIRMDAKTMESLAVAITKLFPTESSTTYYIPRTKTKNASGKLYDRYYNQKNKRKCLEAPSTSKLCRQSDETPTVSVEVVENAKDIMDFQSTKEWLINNLPQDIITPWKETSVLRLKENKSQLRDFLEGWPRYKDSDGYVLIDIDFETLHPGKKNALFEKIIDLEKVIIEKIVPIYVKDQLNMLYFEKMRIANDTNTKHLYFFYLLHAIITPPRVTKNEKPSITDAQNDMIAHMLDVNDIATQKFELDVSGLQDKSLMHPKIFVVGDSWDNLTDIFVILNDLSYKVETLLRAVDLVIKMCIVFDLQYSLKSKYVWILLQEYLYEIPSSEKIAKVQNVLNKIRNLQ